MFEKLEDDSKMPFGMHYGTPMADVPADYLIHLYEDNLKDGNVKNYIEDNMSILLKELKKG